VHQEHLQQYLVADLGHGDVQEPMEEQVQQQMHVAQTLLSMDHVITQ
jgi:hypothetical protein